jgi:hypothetical protein
VTLVAGVKAGGGPGLSRREIDAAGLGGELGPLPVVILHAIDFATYFERFDVVDGAHRRALDQAEASSRYFGGSGCPSCSVHR